jgi:hypothetical protein
MKFFRNPAVINCPFVMEGFMYRGLLSQFEWLVHQTLRELKFMDLVSNMEFSLFISPGKIIKAKAFFEM